MNGAESILMKAENILKNVSKDKGLYINYAQIYYVVMEFLKEVLKEGYEFPIDIRKIYNNLELEIREENLNEFMGDGDPHKINRIIGKISIRPDYFNDNKPKITIYIEEKEPPAMVNYALAHELCHLILNYKQARYTDNYCTMPMLPKLADELVADAFAIFLLIPLDKFLETFNDYIKNSKEKGDVPITTEEWLNYLGSVAAVPHYYVACGYEQIRHVAYLMYYIHMAEAKPEEEKCREYGEEILKLYELVKDRMDEETIQLLYQ